MIKTTKQLPSYSPFRKPVENKSSFPPEQNKQENDHRPHISIIHTLFSL